MKSQKCIKDYFLKSITNKRSINDSGLNTTSNYNQPKKKQKTLLNNEGRENVEHIIQTDTVECVKNDKLTLPCEAITEDENNPYKNSFLLKLSSYCQKYPILQLSIGKSWFKALEDEFNKPYFKKLNDFIVSERKKDQIFPPEDKVWTWTLCAVEDVKVVIIGQDPYHHPGQAHGLCFSVPVNVTPPHSLLNIYKELASDIDGFEAPKHGYLIGWSRQGVLLLNSVLTVQKYKANSHKDCGWEELTTAVIKHLSTHREGIVFLLWGAYAQKKASVVNKNKHHLLTSVHPSPLSAHRGFFGCHHFSRCNELLVKQGKTPIDWKRLPAK